MARASTCWAVSVAPNAIFFLFDCCRCSSAHQRPGVQTPALPEQEWWRHTGQSCTSSHSWVGGEVGRLWFPVHPWLSQLEVYLCYTGPCLREKMHSDLFHLNILWPFPPWQRWLMTITSKACSAKRLACPSETQPIVGECLREGLDVSVDSGCVFLALSLRVFR